jgi:hypothetical protein
MWGEQDENSTDHKDTSYFTLRRIGSDTPAHVNWTTWHDVWLILGGYAEGEEGSKRRKKRSVGKERTMSSEGLFMRDGARLVFYVSMQWFRLRQLLVSCFLVST